MIVIGITGEIGTGKTKTTEILKKIGYKVFSSDECAKNLIREEFIKKRIGKLFQKKVKSIITSNDKVDVSKLGEYVFRNPRELNKLENLLHPLIKAEETKFLKKASIIRERIVFLDIPVMFIKKTFLKCDFIINLSVNKQIQKTRVLMRPRMTEQKFRNILRRQKYDRKKYYKYISININTGNGTFFVFQKIKEFLKKIKKKKINKVWPGKYIYFNNYEKNNS
mgnify:CR=1 FL=1|tara:strand:+ start:276 stop:944 length:669 start_codon:yes stop_codon:yes gene_type:complete